MSAGTKFVLGLGLTAFVVALFAMKPEHAADVPAALDASVRLLSLLIGAWIASTLMYPYLLRR